MFDPSKLDLNLDSEETNLDKKPEKEEEKIETTKEEEEKQIIKKEDEAKNKDILANLKVEKTIDEKEEKIEDIVENPLLEIIDNDIINENESQIVQEEVIKNKEKEKNEEEKIIYDVNITDLQIVLYLLVDKEYDFVTFEPSNENIKLEFRKNKVVIDTKYIKYPTYSGILLKAKSLTKLKLDETTKDQEGFGEINLRSSRFKVITKTVAGDLGEKLFLKIKKLEKKLVKKEAQKMSFSQITTFLSAIAFIGLIMGGGFIGFVAMNAQTVEDVKFFAGLGINLNEINNFISKIISIIFSILLLIETVFLIIFIFKFFFTKKDFKQKRIKLAILSSILLIITFVTGSFWMLIDKKIKSLPNWQELALGEVQIFDNSKLLSQEFDKAGAIIENTSNIIGPVDIKFDIGFLAEKEESRGMRINKFLWEFSDGDTIETPESFIIKTFDKKGNIEVKLTLFETDIQGDIIEKVIEDIPSINISYLVKIEEKIISSGGKTVSFDASDLSNLGEIEWYNLENLDNPMIVSEKYFTDRPIFEETLLGIYIRRNDREDEILDKVFIIKGEAETSIDGKITETKSIINDLEYSFKITDIENAVGNGYIEKYEWFIGDKEYTKTGDITNPEKASEITHTFETFGDKNIKVILTNSSGESKNIEKVVNIPKIISLKNGLSIYYDDEKIEDIGYNKNLNEYLLNNIGVPGTIKLDARGVRSESTLYIIKEVNWDYNSDGDNDYSGKVGEYSIIKEGNQTITVNFLFENRKDNTDIINLEQKIFIEAIKKEAIVDFKIVGDNYYAPTSLGFDASKSKLSSGNISLFKWDFGDGTYDDGDSIVQSHKYNQEGEYKITLTIVSDSGKTYSESKTIIIKPKNQSAEITSSMKSAPAYQGIDFSSKNSQGQITSYFWDFGDGETSTEANPSHSYKNPGKYKTKLILEFSNRNTLTDTLDIEIYED